MYFKKTSDNKSCMTFKSNFQKHKQIIDKKLEAISFRSNNFDIIPPIIGIIIADQFGNLIMVLEHDNKEGSKYPPIKSYLNENHKNLLELDLISMYFSSFKTFAGQTNIQNLSHLEIYGSNIKIQIYFLFEKYIIIIFLNSNTDLSSKEKAYILNYFEEKLGKYEYDFDNFNLTSSRRTISLLENQGKIWLKMLNNNYIRNSKKIYLRKHEKIEKFTINIEPIIRKELNEYLQYMPDDFVDNLCKEIINKIQDKMFEIKRDSI